MMSGRSKTPGQDPGGGERSGKPFIHPLALALTCFILILLLVIMRFYDLRTLDRTLISSMEKQGTDTIKNVGRIADMYFQQIVHTDSFSLYIETDYGFGGESLSLAEELLLEILATARRIDQVIGTGPIRPASFKAYADRLDLSIIALFDHSGRLAFSNRSLPSSLRTAINPVIQGKEALKVHLYTGIENTGGIRFVALRRHNGHGTIVLALDDDAFRLRCLKFSVQRAIEENRSTDAFGYFEVRDREDRILARTLNQSLPAARDHDVKNVLEGRLRSVSRKIRVNGRNQLEIIVPVQIGNHFSGVSRIGLLRDSADRILQKTRQGLFLSLAFMAIMAFLSLWLLYKNQNRYLGKVREMERRINRAERLSAAGRLAAGVAHEIRNPLNAISMAIQRLERDNPHALTSLIRDEIRRLNSIIEDFLNISRSRKLSLKQHDINTLVEQIVFLMREESESKKIAIEARYHVGPLMVSVDLDRMKQAFLNILKNAIESISEGGTISIGIAPSRKKWAQVRITDTGAGLSHNEIQHIFDPDYTTKDKGLGLGLPIALEIIRGHDGDIHVTSHGGEGTTFDIILPLAQ
ncbi:MAG: hypothetical protein JRJ85_18025 [Deltaproteobacteria bacterium]|nr:hypothetical protein [Deltaproteobacteria bacterium]